MAARDTRPFLAEDIDCERFLSGVTNGNIEAYFLESAPNIYLMEKLMREYEVIGGPFFKGAMQMSLGAEFSDPELWEGLNERFILGSVAVAHKVPLETWIHLVERMRELRELPDEQLLEYAGQLMNNVTAIAAAQPGSQGQVAHLKATRLLTSAQVSVNRHLFEEVMLTHIRESLYFTAREIVGFIERRMRSVPPSPIPLVSIVRKMIAFARSSSMSKKVLRDSRRYEDNFKIPARVPLFIGRFNRNLDVRFRHLKQISDIIPVELGPVEMAYLGDMDLIELQDAINTFKELISESFQVEPLLEQVRTSANNFLENQTDPNWHLMGHKLKNLLIHLQSLQQRREELYTDILKSTRQLKEDVRHIQIMSSREEWVKLFEAKRKSDLAVVEDLKDNLEKAVRPRLQAETSKLKAISAISNEFALNPRNREDFAEKLLFALDRLN